MTTAENLVQTVAREAIRVAGKADTLADLIEGQLGRRYNHRTVSGWARGESMPPADALLVVAKVTRVSLDKLLFGTVQVEQMGERVAEALGTLATGKRGATEAAALLDKAREIRELLKPGR